MAIRIFVFSITLLSAVSCASLRENYTTRYGLTNPDNSSAGEMGADETYSVGVVGQQYIEDYDKKFHEKHVLRENPEGPSGEQSGQEEVR